MIMQFLSDRPVELSEVFEGLVKLVGVTFVVECVTISCVEYDAVVSICVSKLKYNVVCN